MCVCVCKHVKVGEMIQSGSVTWGSLNKNGPHSPTGSSTVRGVAVLEEGCQ